jgi:hypothetical protein
VSYYIFLSYTHHDDDIYLKRFLDDLTDAIDTRVALKPGEKIIFFDRDNIKRGDKWDETIVDALQHSKVMVCIYSPNYFSREYCGKEWDIFHQRCQLYQAQRLAAGDQWAKLPPMIKPVIWAPFITEEGPRVLPEHINKDVSGIQFTQGQEVKALNKHGLYQVLKGGRRSKLYTDYVRDLAEEILASAAGNVLPELTDVLPLDKVTSAFFVESGPGQPTPRRQITISKRDHVRFVFVAAERGNWMPFLPDEDEAVFLIVQRTVSSELNFTSDELSFDDALDLRTEVEKAWSEGKLVVLLVDGGTIAGDHNSRQRLEEFDHDNDGGGHFYYNCSVLVPWNDKDQYAGALRPQIEQTIEDTFHFRTNILKNRIYYRDSIRNKVELRDALYDILIAIKAEMRKKVEVSRPLPAGSDNPGVIGPGPANG